MRILVTGANGFVGRNLCSELNNRGYLDVIKYDKDTSPEVLDIACATADFIFHLAGVNRPEKNKEFFTGNVDFTLDLTRLLEHHKNFPSILVSSSIQAELENPYGLSKKRGEQVVFDYAKNHQVPVFVFRLANLFGKWSRPNYNSVVATWCYNIARGLPVQINDPEHRLSLVYIDDVVDAFISAMEGHLKPSNHYFEASNVTDISLGKLAELISSFYDQRNTRLLPDFSVPFVKNLYSTYLSYLPEDSFCYPLITHADHRGSFSEFIRTVSGGQVSINVSKPGISKGDHWHHTKVEKFLVVSGVAKIRFRNIYEDRIIEYTVSSEDFEVVDIPVGYTHEIINIGNSDLVTVMWANENFDPDNPDTYSLEVEV